MTIKVKEKSPALTRTPWIRTDPQYPLQEPNRAPILSALGTPLPELPVRSCNRQTAHNASKGQRKGDGLLLYTAIHLKTFLSFSDALSVSTTFTYRTTCHSHGLPCYFCPRAPIRASAKASHGNDAAAAAAAAAADIFILFDVDLIPYKYSSMSTHARPQ